MGEDFARAELSIEIAHAGPRAQSVAVVKITPPATVADALRLVAGDPRFAGVDLGGASVGIFGVVVPRGQLLEPGDRVEIYTALQVDPKLARRRRAGSKTLSKSARS